MRKSIKFPTFTCNCDFMLTGFLRDCLEDTNVHTFV